MFGWGSVADRFLEAFNSLFSWKTGGRTKDENTLRDTAQHWREEYAKAMRGGDLAHANFALAELRRVRDEAKSKQRP
jgi:hypothetical protein